VNYYHPLILNRRPVGRPQNLECKYKRGRDQDAGTTGAWMRPPCSADVAPEFDSIKEPRAYGQKKVTLSKTPVIVTDVYCSSLPYKALRSLRKFPRTRHLDILATTLTYLGSKSLCHLHPPSKPTLPFLLRTLVIKMLQ
jgi:hypothetical protein